MNNALRNVLSLSLLALLAVGCASTHVAVPGGTPLGGMSTGASYDVVGDAEGTASGTVILGLFTLGDVNRRGSTGGGAIGLPDPIEQAAVYNAIASVPGADALIAPRYHNDVTSYFLWKNQTSTVRGKAVRINP